MDQPFSAVLFRCPVPGASCFTSTRRNRWCIWIPGIHRGRADRCFSLRIRSGPDSCGFLLRRNFVMPLVLSKRSGQVSFFERTVISGSHTRCPVGPFRGINGDCGFVLERRDFFIFSGGSEPLSCAGSPDGPGLQPPSDPTYFRLHRSLCRASGYSCSPEQIPDKDVFPDLVGIFNFRRFYVGTECALFLFAECIRPVEVALYKIGERCNRETEDPMSRKKERFQRNVLQRHRDVLFVVSGGN